MIPVGEKVVSESQTYFFGDFLALRNKKKLAIGSFASLRNLSRPGSLVGAFS